MHYDRGVGIHEPVHNRCLFAAFLQLACRPDYEACAIDEANDTFTETYHCYLRKRDGKRMTIRVRICIIKRASTVSYVSFPRVAGRCTVGTPVRGSRTMVISNFCDNERGSEKDSKAVSCSAGHLSLRLKPHPVRSEILQFPKKTERLCLALCKDVDKMCQRITTIGHLSSAWSATDVRETLPGTIVLKGLPGNVYTGYRISELG